MERDETAAVTRVTRWKRPEAAQAAPWKRPELVLSGGVQEQISQLADHVVSEMIAANAGSVAVAESLTGGLLAAAITAVPGASMVFRGSVTAYATDIKASVLGVDADLLAREGAVHPEVARQMADGARRLLGAKVGLATTGVAGPTKQDGKPVGLVYLGYSISGGSFAEELRLDGDREAIRAETVLRALKLMHRGGYQPSVGGD